MKKTLLAMAAFICAAAMPTQAQNYTYHSFNDATYDDGEGNDATPLGYFHHVSANGKYATGFDYDMGTYAAYLWTADDPEGLSYINTDYGMAYGCYDVTNDGVVFGSLPLINEDGDIENLVPGYRTTDGTWHQLPIPASYANGSDNEYASNANCVTPDGKFVAGTLVMGMGRYHYSSFYKTWLELTGYAPVLWKQNADGTGYELDTCYTDLGKQAYRFNEETGAFDAEADSVNYKTFQVWDISNDGSIIVGMNEAGTGGFNPAFIRDGKLYQLFNCGEEYVKESDYDEWAKTANLNGGVITSVDANNNLYGYYVTSENTNKYFTFTNEDKLVYLQSLVVAATKDGTQITSSYNGLSYCLDCSEDGATVVGGTIAAVGDAQTNAPALLYDAAAAGIGRATAANEPVSIDCRAGGALFINGLYNHAAIYNAEGKLVAEGVQGRSFNLTDKAAGVYVVKVNTANGTKTFKLAR